MLNLVSAHPLNAPESILVTEPRSSTSESFVQPSNALAPIEETVEGIVIEVRLEQFLKAYVPIVSIPSDRMTVDSPVQPDKDMVSTEPGIVNDSILVHPLTMMLRTPSRSVTFLSEVQPSKAPCLIVFNEAGNVMETSLEQSLNAYWPIVSTEFPSVSVPNFVQPSKAESAIVVTPFPIEALVIL